MVVQRMEETNFYTGSTMTMIAMETVVKSKRINQACKQGYTMLIEAFRHKLLSGGMEAQADFLATLRRHPFHVFGIVELAGSFFF